MENRHRTMDSDEMSHCQFKLVDDDNMQLSPVVDFATSHFPIPHETYTDVNICMACDRVDTTEMHNTPVNGTCHILSSHGIWSSRFCCDRGIVRCTF
jgi:hypothetical protein